MCEPTLEGMNFRFRQILLLMLPHHVQVYALIMLKQKNILFKFSLLYFNKMSGLTKPFKFHSEAVINRKRPKASAEHQTYHHLRHVKWITVIHSKEDIVIFITGEFLNRNYLKYMTLNG